MAHLVETMAYSGNTPWHGLGVKVESDLTPHEMLVEAGLDWSVEKQDIYLANGNKLDKKALVRSTDSSVLSIVGNEWNPVQNEQAFEFFNDFVSLGGMEMHTAGSLRDGKMVWALAKVNESFKIFGMDKIDSYLLFSNPHEFGKCIDVKFVATRVVCNNTLAYALDQRSKHHVKIHHAKKFDAEIVKETLGFSKERMEMYKQQALFIGSRYYTKDSLTEYFMKIFAKTSDVAKTQNRKKELSKNAEKALEIIHTQPGANFAEGTYYQAFNTVTYMIDHIVGGDKNRLYSAWYGNGNVKKTNALKLALEMAKVA